MIIVKRLFIILSLECDYQILTIICIDKTTLIIYLHTIFYIYEYNIYYLGTYLLIYILHSMHSNIIWIERRQNDLIIADAQ